MKRAIRIATGVAVLLLFASAAHAGNPFGGGSSSQPVACGEAGTVTLTGKTKLWPPNHKMSNYTLGYGGGSEGESLNFHASHNEIDPATGEEFTGTGKRTNVDVSSDSSTTVTPVDTGTTDPETGETIFDYVASTGFQLRAERSGHGTGRTYTVEFSVSGAEGDTCSGTFTVFVPHDRRGGRKAF